jgi:REP element-mobilizing transposase RayT
MPYDPKFHHRHSFRWKGYDYSSRGIYFLTICTQNRIPFLSRIENRRTVLTGLGKIVHVAWSAIPDRFPEIEVGPFVVMPNHIHGILANVGHIGVGTKLRKEGAASSAPTLGTIIRAFKSVSAIGVKRQSGTLGGQVWQRNYYEHVIRDGKEYGIISRYIWENPARWEFDPDNLASKIPDRNLPWKLHQS